MAAKTYTKIKVAISATVAVGVLVGSAFLGVNGPSASNSTLSAASGVDVLSSSAANTTSSSTAATTAVTKTTSTTKTTTARKSRAS